jgi:uncharacterized membrane protein YfcA
MDNTTIVTVVLTVVCFITSMISAILGMGGGILLLAAMFSVLPHMLVVPLHACVQLVSNFTRVLAYIKDVNWKILGFFLCGALPSLAIAAFVFKELYAQKDGIDPYMKTLVGLYILIVTYRKKNKQENKAPLYKFAILGTYAAPISLFFGATGPLMAPYFIRKDFHKEMIVASKAVCQFVVHMLKLGIFVWLWNSEMGKLGAVEALKEPSKMLVFLLSATIMGTLVGKKLMKKVSEKHFRKFYVIVLNVAGFKILIFDGLWGLIQAYNS